MTAPDLDALIARLSDHAAQHHMIYSGTLCREAAAELTRLREENARLRNDTAEIDRSRGGNSRLQNDMAEIDRLRGENARIKDARLFPAGYELYRTSEINRIAALEAERDALQKNCTVLVQMFELAAAIPSMSDEQLRQLVANGRAAIDAARSKP